MFHFAKPWGGLRLLTRVKVFCRFNSEFRWNSTLYEAGIFGTGYTSTHKQVNIQKTNYTLRRLYFLPGSTIYQVLCAAPFLVTQLISQSSLSYLAVIFWYNYSMCHHELSGFHQIFISSTMVGPRHKCMILYFSMFYPHHSLLLYILTLKYPSNHQKMIF